MTQDTRLVACGFTTTKVIPTTEGWQQQIQTAATLLQVPLLSQAAEITVRAEEWCRHQLKLDATWVVYVSLSSEVVEME